MRQTVIFSKASVERKPEYRQQTLILTDGERRWVRKLAVGRAAADHIKRYKTNLDKLTNSLKPGGRVDMIPCRENADGSVDFPFLTDPTLAERLAGMAPEDYFAAVRAFEDALTEAFETCPFEAWEDFRRFYGIVPEVEGSTALVTANADLNFDNVFCGPDGRYTIIDYEWVQAFPLPLSFLTYRSLMLDPAFNAFSEAEKRALLERLGIGEALEAQYHQMELAFLEYISPDIYKLDYFARIPGARQNVVFSIDDFGQLPKLIRDNDQLLSENKNLYATLQTAYEALEEERERIRIKQVLRGLARKNRLLWKTWGLLAYLRHCGFAALAHKIRSALNTRAARKRLMKALDDPAAAARQRQDKSLPRTVKFSVVVPLYNTPESFLREMVQSVQDQTYANWELCLADGSDPSHGEVGRICTALADGDDRIVYKKLERNGGISENTNAAIAMAAGDYIALFDHDDLLHPSALYENAKAIYAEGADFLYSDEVVFASPDRHKLIATHFKPDFSPESLYSNNYICHLSVFRRSLLERSGIFRKDYDGSQDYDIILRLTDCAQKVVHIPKVLYFWRSHPTSVASDIDTKTYAIDAGKNAIRNFFSARRKTEVFVESVPEYPTMYHVWYPVDRNWTVDIILDWVGQDRGAAADRFEALRAHTLYGNAAFTVVLDADPTDEERRRFPQVNWLRCAQENRAARLNEAIRATRGDCVALLDAELAAERDDWVEQMLMLAMRERIGAVGGKAYFADRTLRHAGLILGLGGKRLIGRSHFGTEIENNGYFGQLAVVGNVSAVSAECMMVRRAQFEALGGFDAEYGDALFDADLCLRLSESGCRNVYTPFALFVGGASNAFALDYGVESKSYPQDAARFKQRWAQALGAPDPCYNPNLTLDFSDYRVG